MVNQRVSVTEGGQVIVSHPAVSYYASPFSHVLADQSVQGGFVSFISWTLDKEGLLCIRIILSA